MTRRTFLSTTGLAGLAPGLAPGLVPGLVPGLAPALAGRGRRLPGHPFELGVASGDPTADGVVLWTRLAPRPLAEDGYGGMPPGDVDVEWQLADDERFRRVIRTGRTVARRANAFSVHVELTGLPPGREFFYRFRAAGRPSPAGRTRTAPAPGTMPPLTFAAASCSHYEQGYFTAYRRLAERDPDLVVHLGDYMYEYAPGGYRAPSGIVRDHTDGRCQTLTDYRRRHAQYKTDPDLRAAHATAPWAVVWDDHELENNWAGDDPGTLSPRPTDPDRPPGAPGSARASARRSAPTTSTCRCAAPSCPPAIATSSSAGWPGETSPPSTCSTPGSTVTISRAATASARTATTGWTAAACWPDRGSSAG